MKIIDAGIEHIHIWDGKKSKIIKNNDDLEVLLKKDIKSLKKGSFYVTGKLAEIVQKKVGFGEVIISQAALWSAAKEVKTKEKSLGIIDLSASGFLIICIDEKGDLKNDLLITNPKCGAGSGVNLNRILQKLDIKKQEVDIILKDYLGKKGQDKREKVIVRADRCGVFSSSATISDKNQGIPLDYALAVTLKSEVLKATKKMLPSIDKVYLTGRVFNWQYARDCAKDYLESVGVKSIEFDENQLIFIKGVERLIKKLKIFRKQEKKLTKDESFVEYSSFKELYEKFTKEKIFCRIDSPEVIEKVDSVIPVHLGLDIGSTMAKIVIVESLTNKLIYLKSYENHGDTIQTIKKIFSDIKDKGIKTLNIQNIGITGSGRYQVKKLLGKVYPSLTKRIFTLVENYAHARGSIEYAKEHIKKFKDINKDFCVLVDIGGEDTKVSTISLKQEEMFDNVMNIKCSAGTGSLMDTLKSMFGIESIEEACRKAYEAPKAYEINATCAVFLMENARRMEALGYSKGEILASCNYAIVENMTKTLWNQINFPKNSVVLLHGQTMLSDPLPLVVTKKIQDSKMYCLVPPYPGHRACIGLIKSIKEKKVIDNPCNLSKLIDLKFDKKIVMCRGVVCGDREACCARTLLKGEDISLVLGGCTAINDLSSKKCDCVDSYKEIWSFIDSRMPKSNDPKRLVIPRCFAVSGYAYFFAKFFEKLGIPVHVDNVKEEDIFNAQPLFKVDVCAPLIGTTGQFLRVASEKHGIIFVPQLDFLPTEGKSLGKTCTTNQGGVIMAKYKALMKYPSANFLSFDLSFREINSSFLLEPFTIKLKKLFDFYGLEIKKTDLKKYINYAIEEDYKLKEDVANLACKYIKRALKEKRNIALVCAREYILNPGIYDSHIGRLLKDKGVIALPSYIFDVDLNEKFKYLYWKNPHDLITKIEAVKNGTLSSILKNSSLKRLIKDVENSDINLSIVQVSTFRCGPDTVTLPITNEIMKTSPNLFIQSDAIIKELAHLENRVNTFVNQLNGKLHDKFFQEEFDIKLINNFAFDNFNKETDVLYFPTLHDNKIITSIFRSAGITTIDIFDEESYDLKKKIKFGRKYIGDFVCAPLAAVFADIVIAVDDFKKRKKEGDPLVEGKKRVLIFDIKGEGPCRQGQYYEIHKFLTYKAYDNVDWIKILVGKECEGYNVGFDEWVILHTIQGLIIHGILFDIFLQGGAECSNYDEFQEFYFDFLKLKGLIYKKFENIRPNKKIVNALKKNKDKNPLNWVIKYFGYGLYNNNGFRRMFQDFSRKWIKNPQNRLKIHIEGEAYMRIAQLDDIFRYTIDSIGFQSFKMTHTPLWCYLELLMEEEKNILNENINLSKGNSKVNKEKIKKINLLIWLLRNILAKPLYNSAQIEVPHKMSKVLENTKKHFIPSLKPYGELPAYLGEAILKINEGYDLFFNVAPEGCMVSSMGECFSSVLNGTFDQKTRVQELFSLNGEVDVDQIQISLLKIMKPEGYYRVC